MTSSGGVIGDMFEVPQTARDRAEADKRALTGYPVGDWTLGDNFTRVISVRTPRDPHATGILWRGDPECSPDGWVECFAAADVYPRPGYWPGEFVYDRRLTGWVGNCQCDRCGGERRERLPEVPREVPAPARGTGPVRCCGGHREKCLSGRQHFWATWYEDGQLQRTYQTVHCYTCGGVCTAEEEEESQP
jgi:hypothetical protein